MPFIQLILSLLAGVGGQFGIQKLLGFGAKKLGSAALKKAGVAAGSAGAKKVAQSGLQNLLGNKTFQGAAGFGGFLGASAATDIGLDALINGSEPRDVAPEPDVQDIFNLRRGPDENIAGLQRIMSQAELRSVLESLGVSEQDFIGTSLGGFL